MSLLGFGGLKVVSFESRRSVEMASLITRHGGVPVSAPSMREVPHAEPSSGRDLSPRVGEPLDGPSADVDLPGRTFAEALRRGAFYVVVLMTGAGSRALMEAAAPALAPVEFAAALRKVVVVVRGPKPAAVLREIGVTGFLPAPEPNTWREVLAVVRDALRGGGPRHIAVQEHGAPSRELYAELEKDGHSIHAFSVYRWALPEDTAPLRAAVRAVASGEVAIALFTSATQVHHVMRVAAEEGIEDAVRSALSCGVVASIGPVCTEALADQALPPDLQPEHSKMGHLVKEAAARSRAILAAKKGNRYSSDV